MQEDQFWEYISLIDSFPYKIENRQVREDIQTLLIKKELKKQPFKVSLDFDRIFNEKMDELLTVSIVELYMVNSLPVEKLKRKDVYISNDGFRDFRAYIIGLGKQDYKLIKQFKSENEIFHIDFNINIAYRSDIEFVLRNLYENHFSKLNDKEIVRQYQDHKAGVYFADFSEILGQINWKSLDKKYPKMKAKIKY